ncbi:hypothetical protein [Rhodopirellula bahusiensis]|uniref:hypothetical protein n=1 Tax=Rhodopirellula bahusiensis TaxID=2014065 RepID=UPI003267A9FA
MLEFWWPIASHRDSDIIKSEQYHFVSKIQGTQGSRVCHRGVYVDDGTVFIDIGVDELLFVVGAKKSSVV